MSLLGSNRLRLVFSLKWITAWWCTTRFCRRLWFVGDFKENREYNESHFSLCTAAQLDMQKFISAAWCSLIIVFINKVKVKTIDRNSVKWVFSQFLDLIFYLPQKYGVKVLREGRKQQTEWMSLAVIYSAATRWHHWLNFWIEALRYLIKKWQNLFLRRKCLITSFGLSLSL